MARNNQNGISIWRFFENFTGTTGLVKFLLTILILLLPLLYDRTVPDSARDIRGNSVVQTVLISVILMTIGWILSCRKTVSLDFPLAVSLVFMLALLAILSCVDTIHPYRSWFFIKFFIGYCGLFTLVYVLREDRWYGVLSWMLVLPLLFNGFLIICQVHGISDQAVSSILPIWKQIGFIDHFRQAIPPAATFSNKNLAASWIVLILPLCLYHFINTKNNWLTILSSSLLVLGLLALFYTHSRTSWISSIGSFLFLAIWLFLHPAYWALFKSGITRLKLTIGSVLIFAAGLSITIMLFSGRSSIIHSMKSKIEGLISLLSGNRDALEERLGLTLNSLKIPMDYPFNGTGIGTFHTIYPYYQNATAGLPASTKFALGVRPERTHNDLLQIIVEMGVLSGLIFAGLFVVMLVMGRRMAHEDSIEKAGMLPVFLLTGIVGMALNALGDFPLQMPTAIALLFVMMAMLTGKYVLHARQQKSHRMIEFSRRVSVTTLAVLLSITSLVFYDNILRREGAKPLKAAGYLTMTGQFNDKNMNLLETSHKTYPWNSRLMDFRCATYANYRGAKNISLKTKITVLEDCLKYDRYNVVTLVNLGSIYYRQAILFINQGRHKTASLYIGRISQIAKTLLHIVPDAPQGATLSGMAYLAAGHLTKAKSMFEHALKKDRKFQTAKAGLKVIKLRAKGVSFIKIQSMKLGKKFGMSLTLNAQGKRAILRQNR